MNNTLQSLTVNELIEELQELVRQGHGDCTVAKTSDYGDRCHTQQALAIDEIQVGGIEESAYSDSGYRAVDEEDMDEEEEEQETVILL